MGNSRFASVWKALAAITVPVKKHEIVIELSTGHLCGLFFANSGSHITNDHRQINEQRSLGKFNIAKRVWRL